LASAHYMRSWSDIEIRETAEQAIHRAQAGLEKANKANGRSRALSPRAISVLLNRLNKLTLTIDRPQLSPEDEKRLMEAEKGCRRCQVAVQARAADGWEQCRCLLLALSGRCVR
jgi:hypothetical protein